MESGGTRHRRGISTSRFVTFLYPSLPLLSLHTPAANTETARKCPATSRTTVADRGRQRLVKRWNDVQRGDARSGLLGTRIMGQAGGCYVPTEEEIIATATFRGKVNNDVAGALRGGQFSQTAVTMIATDVILREQDVLWKVGKIDINVKSRLLAL